MYADTDFYLALLKERDWLKERAVQVCEKKGSVLYTSVVTVVELLLLAKRFSLDPERLLACVFGVTPRVVGIEKGTALEAAHYMKRKKVNVFDALHAAYCGGHIVSSDKVFDRLGLSRLKLEKA